MNITLFYEKAFLISCTDRVSLNCKNVCFVWKYSETELSNLLVKYPGKNNSKLFLHYMIRKDLTPGKFL